MYATSPQAEQGQSRSINLIGSPDVSAAMFIAFSER